MVKPGIQVITPNPKTSGGARWAYLAAWGYAQQAPGGTQATAKDFVTRLYKNVPVLDSGARGSTTTFVERGVGDVLLSWENEAYLAVNQFGKDKFEIVYPSMSILGEPPVALVDKVVDRHGTREVALEYLNIFTPMTGSEIAAKHYFRPRLASADEVWTGVSEAETLYGAGVFGGWQKAQADPFCRWRRLRSDLSAGIVELAADAMNPMARREQHRTDGRMIKRTAGIAGLRPDDGLYAHLPGLIALIPLSTLFLKTAGMGWARFLARRRCRRG